eukprot:5496293-Pleurochrysis_carterae.AAC.1
MAHPMARPETPPAAHPRAGRPGTSQALRLSARRVDAARSARSSSSRAMPERRPRWRASCGRAGRGW